MKNNVGFYKFLAISAVGLYFYKSVRGNNNKLIGDTDKIVDHVMLHTSIPNHFKPIVENIAKQACKSFAEHQRGMKDIKNAKVRDVG